MTDGLEDGMMIQAERVLGFELGDSNRYIRRNRERGELRCRVSGNLKVVFHRIAQGF